jgi:REP element-mobilizing transposase RayT
MKYKKHKQYRYKEYDYSQDGFYFVTICTKNRELFFGDIVVTVGTDDGTGQQNDGTGQCPVPAMELSEIGKIAQKFWQEIPNRFPFVKLHEFIVMPNHIHGIIQIKTVGAGHCPVHVETEQHHGIYQNETEQHNETDDETDAETDAETDNGTGQQNDEKREHVKTDDGTGQCPVPTTISKFGQVTPNSISTIIGSYKSIVTKIINMQLPDFGFAWQPRFHDRIIRNEIELNKTRQYIIDNPYKWHLDRNNLENLYM